MFRVGDMIAHTHARAGIIERIEEENRGLHQQYYVLKMPLADGCDDPRKQRRHRRTADRGFRNGGIAMRLMSEIEADMTANWNRRYRENMQRLKSGDLIESRGWSRAS
jgi:CarD family transcriptional regulator